MGDTAMESNENFRRRLRADVEKEWEDIPLDTKLNVVYEYSDDDFVPSKKVSCPDLLLLTN